MHNHVESTNTLTSLHAKLQQLTRRKAIDYYLISQLNTKAERALIIFR